MAVTIQTSRRCRHAGSVPAASGATAEAGAAAEAPAVAPAVDGTAAPAAVPAAVPSADGSDTGSAASSNPAPEASGQQEYQHTYFKLHQQHLQALMRKWRREHPAEIRALWRQAYARRVEVDPLYNVKRGARRKQRHHAQKLLQAITREEAMARTEQSGSEAA